MNDATKWRFHEGSIELFFEDGWRQVLCVSRTQWTRPDYGKNQRFREATQKIGETVALQLNTFDQAREALKDACLTYAVHGEQPPQKWLDALAAMEAKP